MGLVAKVKIANYSKYFPSNVVDRQSLMQSEADTGGGLLTKTPSKIFLVYQDQNTLIKQSQY